MHALPPALSSLSQLVELNLSKNVLLEIPDTVKQLKHLAVLDASVNPLQKIPEGCTQGPNSIGLKSIKVTLGHFGPFLMLKGQHDWDNLQISPLLFS